MAISLLAMGWMMASFLGCGAPGGGEAVQTAGQKERGARKEQESRNMKETKRKTWAKSPCTGIVHLPELDRLTPAELEAQLGAPRNKESFPRGERQDEFHVLLENFYPLKKAGNRDVPLQEWTWTEKDCQLTVWLHEVSGRWISFVNSRYSASADF